MGLQCIFIWWTGYTSVYVHHLRHLPSNLLIITNYSKICLFFSCHAILKAMLRNVIVVNSFVYWFDYLVSLTILMMLFQCHHPYLLSHLCFLIELHLLRFGDHATRQLWRQSAAVRQRDTPCQRNTAASDSCIAWVNRRREFPGHDSILLASKSTSFYILASFWLHLLYLNSLTEQNDFEA